MQLLYVVTATCGTEVMFVRSVNRQALKIGARGVHVEARIASLGITLPDPTGEIIPTRPITSFYRAKRKLSSIRSQWQHSLPSRSHSLIT